MATLVKFVKYPNYDLTAVFPQLNYNKRLYGINRKVCYSHIGQHSACDKVWLAETSPATPNEYDSLKKELEGLGYILKVCK